MHLSCSGRITRQDDDARSREPSAQARQQTGEHCLVAEIAETVIAAD
jgi:hypothetical protein